MRKPANNEPKCPQKSTPGIIEIRNINRIVIAILRFFTGITLFWRTRIVKSNQITLHMDVEAPTPNKSYPVKS